MTLSHRRGVTSFAPFAVALALAVSLPSLDRLLAEEPSIVAEQEVKKAEADPGRMPWHLIDTWMRLKETRVATSLSLDVTIEGEIAEGTRLYVATMGLGKINEISFYGGLQTESDGKTRENPRLRRIGRGALFSRWDERDLAAIRTSDEGLLESSVTKETSSASASRSSGRPESPTPTAWRRWTASSSTASSPYWVGAFVEDREGGQ